MARKNASAARPARRGMPPPDALPEPPRPGHPGYVSDPVNPGDPAETPTQKLDRLAQSAAASIYNNLSPVTLSLAMADWAWHLAASPGRQLELATLAAQLAIDTARLQDGSTNGAGLQDDDPRFRADEWTQWPFNRWRTAFRNAEVFWREASKVPGVSTPR